MRLSPKQLRLVFAKLRERGLLKHSKKKPSYHQLPSDERYPELGIGIREAEHMISRLPRKHQDLSLAQTISIGPGFSQYAPETGAIEVDNSGWASDFPGYGPRNLITRQTREPKSAMGRKTVRSRYVRLDTGRTLYHEYGHSLDLVQTKNKVLQRFSASSTWVNIIRKEWRHSTPVVFSYPGNNKMLAQWHTPPAEAWAESYSYYASGKVGRTKLKKQYPMSYEYMKKFFEEK